MLLEKTDVPVAVDLDAISRRLLSDALAVPTEHLSEIGSWHAHIPFAYALTGIHRPRTVAELGVHKGDSYLTFCRGLVDHDVAGARAWGIDTWQGDPQAGFYNGNAILADLRARHDKPFSTFSALLRKTFDEALADIPDGSVDLLHIDGLHTYEAVRHDYETWRPKVSSRGIVLFHDTQVRTSDFGVWKLWSEISEGRESYDFPYGNGLGVLVEGANVPDETRALLRILRDDHHLAGLSVRDILRRIGEGLASDRYAMWLKTEVARVESGLLQERSQALAEQNRLNAEVEQLRLAMTPKNVAKAAVAKALRDVGRAGKAGAQGSRKLAAHSIAAGRHVARVAGRSAIEALPISDARRLHLKHLILSQVAPLFGIKRGAGDLSAYIMLKNKAVRLVNERYMPLSGMARAPRRDLPPRSVSIVVPVYNQLSYTLACIDAIKENTADVEHEIIVVDDCSGDGTEAALKDRTDIVYVRNAVNLGFVGSCNAGAAAARKTYVCFLNNDTKVLPHWLSALVNTFELNDGVGLAGSKLVYPDGRLQEAGGIIWSDGSGWNWGRNQDPNDPKYCYARRVDYCSGASILLPRALFKALGGFDKLYTPAYGEDSDLAFKVRSLGLSTWYQPLSQVVHFEGQTCGTDTRKGVKKYQVENAEKLAKRWAYVLAHQGTSTTQGAKAADRGILGRILVLDQITPEPDRDAGSITALEIMRALTDLGYKVTFAPCSNLSHIPPYTELLSAVGIESLLIPHTSSVRRHLETSGADYDAVVIFRPKTWHDHIADIRKLAPRARIIYHSSDLHFLRAERQKQVTNDAAESAAAREAELNLLAGADVSIVHSTEEQRILSELRPNARVVCFPWIYEARGEGSPYSEREGIVFVGGYAHPPNVDAVEHYVADIHPWVAAKLPGVKFAALGSSPPPSLKLLEGPEITVPGYVEDLTTALFKARVMAVPMRYGAGIKGKIITSLAHGLPVVSTTIGAEGMELTDGENVLIADTPEEFAAAVVRLYEDEALWTRLRAGGLEYVARTTSREVGLGIISDLARKAGLSTRDDATRHVARSAAPTAKAIARLASAAQAIAPANIADLVIVPDDAYEASAGSSRRTVPVSQAAGPLASAHSVIAIADATDRESVSRLADVLACLPRDATASVIFAPVRLAGNAAGYRVLAPFSDRVVEAIGPPAHEAFAPLFEKLGRPLHWRADTSLVTYPSLPVLEIGPR